MLFLSEEKEVEWDKKVQIIVEKLDKGESFGRIKPTGSRELNRFTAVLAVINDSFVEIDIQYEKNRTPKTGYNYNHKITELKNLLHFKLKK